MTIGANQTLDLTLPIGKVLDLAVPTGGGTINARRMR